MILFLDDEIYAKPYADALEEKGLQVDYVTSVRQALSKLETQSTMYELLLLDCMLPADSKDLRILEGYDVKDGLRTGAALVDYIVEKNIAVNMKIVIITNILEEKFHTKYQNHPRLSGCYGKREIKPDALAEKIVNLLRSTSG